MTDELKLQRLHEALAQAGHTHTVADVADAVKRGAMRWWDNGDGNIVTEITEYPQLKAINYFLVFGELKHCLALEHEINPYAIEQGCSIATACGRPGWLRAAAPTGWKLHGFAYVKALTNGR